VAKEGDAGIIYKLNATHSIEYLEQHGTCLDAIRPANSSIRGAGLGAFATRHFVKDEAILTSPLIHITNHTLLNMYGKEWSQYGGQLHNWKPSEEVESHQLLVNYCFGHRQSPVLLCPYSSGVNYVNHNQSLTNIQIKWTENGRLSHNATVLTLPLSDLPQHKSALAFDYVALRDIDKGEELFLDGGHAWEEAWREHVGMLWEPGSEAYAPASVWNERLQSESLRTRAEQRDNPYPSNLELRCHESLTTDNYSWQSIVKEKGGALWESSDRGLPCNVLGRYVNKKNKTELVYDVNFFVDQEDMEVQNKAVPRNAFAFVDAWYSTDMHLPNAFHYPMQIPNEMLPDKWNKDLAAGA
jgi:hypothetical protein